MPEFTIHQETGKAKMQITGRVHPYRTLLPLPRYLRRF
jgi:hypothetical protein